MRFGIDLGGTKIEIVALGEHGEELLRRRVPTPKGDYPATLRAIVALVEAADRETGQRGSLGVATPGAISPATGLMKNANSTALIGHAFDKDLSELLQRPVRMENDANCFALSEASDGAGAGHEIVFGVILGTGVGAGIVVKGQVLRGRQAVSGEFGHVPLPWPTDAERPGPLCYCGRRACIETFLSGPGLAADHAEVTGQHLKAEDIVARAEEGDEKAEATLQRYEERLARALGAAINLIDPHVIVLGGGLSKLERLYRNVPPLLGRFVFSDVCDTPIVPPRFGDSSGGRGAAWLWQPGEMP